MPNLRRFETAFLLYYVNCGSLVSFLFAKKKKHRRRGVFHKAGLPAAKQKEYEHLACYP